MFIAIAIIAVGVIVAIVAGILTGKTVGRENEARYAREAAERTAHRAAMPKSIRDLRF